MEVLVNHYLNEALGFLDAALAFYWVVEKEGTLICKRRMAFSSLQAVESFLRVYGISNSDIHRNYAVLSKILAYKGAEFWLGHHENQEMLALATYLKRSSSGRTWNTGAARTLANGIVENVLFDAYQGGD